ncbi:MAG: hypothetical protein K0S07_1404 [Chlamydiales bacterium]|nr:hypothetical protein [Chlamydiales bacterium]
MNSIQNAARFILKGIPVLTPAIKKEGDAWEADFALLKMRIYAVAIPAIALCAASTAALLFVAPFIAVPLHMGSAVLAISLLFSLSIDRHCTSREVKRRNIEEFCRLEAPSHSLMRKIAFDMDCIKKVIEQKGDLNKLSSPSEISPDLLALASELNIDYSTRDSLLDVVIQGDCSPSYHLEIIDLLLENGASPLKGQSFMRAINLDYRYTSHLPKFLNAIQEEEIASLKASPDRWVQILRALSYHGQETKNAVLFKLQISLDEMERTLHEYRQLGPDLSAAS